MNANELMIGDLVQVAKDVCIKKGAIVKVCCIDEERVFPEKGLKGCTTCKQIDDDTTSGGVWCEFLKPIPLTPEILEKNGFKEILVEGFFRLESNKDHDYWCVEVSTTKGYELLHLDIEHICDGIGQGGIDNLKICFVHELQHALKLCGIEKEIVL